MPRRPWNEAPSRPRLPVWGAGLAVLLTLAGAAPPEAADFNDVVLLSNENAFFGGYNDVWGFVGNDGREYVIQGTSTGTAWWDVEDPIHPQLVTFLPEPASPWRDMFVIGDRAYIVAENFDQGVRIVDISDPTNPTYVTSYLTTVNQAHNIFGDPSRNLLFVVGGSSAMANGGVQILDASNPDNLVEIGQWNTHYVHDLSIEGNLAFLCLIFIGEMQIIDLTDPTAPVTLGSYVSSQGAVHASWPVGDGTHVLITHETSGGALHSVDVSNPLSPSLADAYVPAPQSSTHNVHVEGTRAWVSWYARGTRVIDVSDPTFLSELGYWDTNEKIGLTDGNWGVFPHFPSGLAAANDRDNGLFLMKYDATAGVLDGTVSPSAGTFLFDPVVDYLDLEMSQTVDSTGAYQFSAFSGPSHSLRFTAFGFQPDSATVALAAGGTTTTNVTLQRLPAGAITGVVTDANTLLPLEGADALVDGTPLIAVSDASG
ncbi:MAG TPA: choice-of-anchor B family protein, partial [bacterium]|nr:choice-of-anchor B family protein [bacterium]